MGAKLGPCLRSEFLHFYVFDFKEQELEGQCNSLLPLGQDQVIILVFELTDPSGNPEWKSKYLSPSPF